MRYRREFPWADYLSTCARYATAFVGIMAALVMLADTLTR